ncbi:hypothetical protein P3X46_035272 [Hevea brasiliensis]|uniref:Uncharacterized protein n=1 Tax=Hevea brasiliensis TaxID=3981 RepID=A0ABQ9KBN6_HEVBR|nr:hypothetical protein P3X46_035272 [Hevea brasiliensis]
MAQLRPLQQAPRVALHYYRLGNLFNEEALVQALIGKKLPKEFRYIKGLKQWFHCPLTRLEFHGKYKFCEFQSDKIVINGSEEELAILRDKREEGRSKVKDEKPKKVKNGEVGINGEDSVGLDSQCLTGKRHGIVDAKVVEKVVGRVETNGKIENVKGVTNDGTVKWFKAADLSPANSNNEAYASIFTSSKKSDFKEIHLLGTLPLCRN